MGSEDKPTLSEIDEKLTEHVEGVVEASDELSVKLDPRTPSLSFDDIDAKLTATVDMAIRVADTLKKKADADRKRDNEAATAERDRDRKYLVAVAGAVFLLLIAVFWVWRQGVDMETQRNKNIATACVQYNVDRLGQRNWAERSAREIVASSQASRAALNQPGLSDQQINQYLDSQVKAAREIFEYRDCTKRGIAEWFKNPPKNPAKLKAV